MGSSAIVKVLGQNDMFVFWGSLQPPKKFFGVFPKVFCTFVSESPAVCGVNGCYFRKISVKGFPNYSLHYISLPNGCCFIKSSLEGSANCALHLPPSLLLGSKLRELFTCLNHTKVMRKHRCVSSPWFCLLFELFVLR